MSDTRSGVAKLAEFARTPVAQMTIAQVFNGACAYVFLGIATRQLGDIEFAPLSVAWAAFFLVGTGCFLPLEQQLSRGLAGRFLGGVGAEPTVLRGIRLLVVGVVAVTAIQLLAGPFIVDRLFSGRWDVFGGLVVGVAGFATLHAGRGIASGLSRHRVWASLFVVEGVLEVAFAVGLLLFDDRDAGTYTFVAGFSSLAAGLIVLGGVVPQLVRNAAPVPRHDAPLHDAPVAPSLATGLPALVVSSLLTAALINAGPVAIELLATEREGAEAGHFLTGLVIARIPVFLVPVIMSLVLPRLVASIRAGNHETFRAGVGRMGLLIVGAIVVSTAGAAALGPAAVRIAFGSEFAVLGARDLAAMAFSSVTLVGAVTIGQAALAMHLERWLMFAWVAAAAAFAVAVSVGDDLLFRVEAALVVSAAVALVVVVAVVGRGSRRLGADASVPEP